MAERIAEIVILAEDINQANFVRRSLKRKGHQSFRVSPLPDGRGSGEQYVREKFADEVAAYRKQSTRRKAALVTVIDADTKPVNRRERELWAVLTSAGHHARKPAEAIAVLIPKRHIETWVLCLVGERVDEATDYTRRRNIQSSIRVAAENFCEWSRPRYPVPGYCVPSLRRALPEIQRIR